MFRISHLPIAAMMMAAVVMAEPTTSTSAKPATIQALQGYNQLIGKWRGVAQPKRGSQSGAWQEKIDAIWELKPKSQGIRWTIDGGHGMDSALLGFDDTRNEYTLVLSLSEEKQRTYRGKVEDKKLVLVSDADEKKEVHRATLTLLNENRFTILFEKRAEQQSFFNRIAEIGYQREGTRLAVAGSSGPECVVTGGLGTIAVTFKGKTYYVCCTGCRDAFNDDPEGTLADYYKRKAEEKAKNESGK